MKISEFDLVPGVVTSIPLSEFVLGAGGTAFTLEQPTGETAVLRLLTPAANGGDDPVVNTASGVGSFLCRLSKFVEPGSDFSLVFNAGLTAAVEVGATIDISVFAVETGAARGTEDLCVTAAQALTTSLADYAFKIDPAAIAPGALFRVDVTIAIDDTGNETDAAKSVQVPAISKRGASRGGGDL